MKSRLGKAGVAALLASLLYAAGPLPARAQNPDTLLPRQSAARARAILEQAIAALGGPAFRNAPALDCRGTAAQFESSGQIGGFVEVRVLRQWPDKTRTEIDAKNFITDIYGIPVSKKGRHIVVLYTAGGAWILGGDGVTELTGKQIQAYNDEIKADIDVILRFRLNEPGLILRYAGSDVVDLKEADWVEVSDRPDRLVRIAIAKLSHLPIRSVLVTRNPKTGERNQSSTTYSAYQAIDGIQTPFRISRYRNGRHISQIFFKSCRYNSDLPADLFARASLDEYFAKHHKH